MEKAHKLPEGSTLFLCRRLCYSTFCPRTDRHKDSHGTPMQHPVFKLGSPERSVRPGGAPGTPATLAEPYFNCITPKLCQSSKQSFLDRVMTPDAKVGLTPEQVRASAQNTTFKLESENIFRVRRAILRVAGYQKSPKSSTTHRVLVCK
jgi:hypothetical protein